MHLEKGMGFFNGPNPDRAFVISEFGVYSLIIADHQGDENKKFQTTDKEIEIRGYVADDRKVER